MIGLLLSMLPPVLLFLASVYALVRSARERYLVGILGGLVRLVLLIAAVISGLILSAISFSPLPIPVPTVSLVAVVSTIAGPLVSFLVLWLAHRRSDDVPAALEEKLARPFRAWMPIAILDAMWVVMNVAGMWFSRGA